MAKDRWTQLRELDQKLVETAKHIKVLSALSWPQSAAEDFVAAHRRGQARLPEPVAASPMPSEIAEALDDVIRRADPADPLGAFLQATATSYRRIGDVIGHTGKREAYEASVAVYGDTKDVVPGTSLTNAEAAERVLARTNALIGAAHHEAADYCVTAAAVQRDLQTRADEVFGAGVVRAVVDASLSAKAAASATRIRVRGGTCFSEEDVRQLIEHELLVHSLTALNGRRQPKLTSLSLGAPRTTATQEGLATFAEFVTGSIDLPRLRRVADRVRLVRLAEDGANFIELYEMLLDEGEPESEAVRTVMRVFRGGDVNGRFVFTKDVVYLRGLLETNTFFMKAIADRRPELVTRLFAGRLTHQDTVGLEEAFASGDIAPPAYMPTWAAQTRTLAAFLVLSTVTTLVDLDSVGLAAFGGSRRDPAKPHSGST